MAESRPAAPSVISQPAAASSATLKQEPLPLDEQFKNRNYHFTVQKVKQREIQKRYAYLLDSLSALEGVPLPELKAALLEREMAVSDARIAAAKAGVAPNSEEYSALRDWATKEAETKIKELLGGNYETFQGLDSMAGAMHLLDEIIGVDIAYGDRPLTAEQKMHLAAVMTELHYSMGDPKFSVLVNEPVDPATGLNPLNQTLVKRASSILSAAQLEILRAYQKEQSAFQAYSSGPSGR